MIKKLLYFSFIISAFTAFPQGEQNIWYFGENAGLDFNFSPPRATSDSSIQTSEGTAVMSDNQGNLLFYTDGEAVINAVHSVMDNGFNLSGNASSAQTSLILPGLSQSSNLYYIFTPVPFTSQLYYSVVDMDANNGRGAVIQKNLSYNGQTAITNLHEKIHAVPHADGDKYWIISYGNTANMGFYRTFILNSTGIDTNSEVISSFPSALSDRRGYIKFSSDGSKVATTSMGGGGALLADFNNATGQVTNQRTVTLPNPYVNSYGVEFSAQSNVLYIDSLTGDGGNSCDAPGARALVSYDLTTMNGHLNPNIFFTMPGENRGALQIGPDNNIYVARPCEQFIGVIENSNVYGGENFRLNGKRLMAGTRSREGLPNMVQVISSTAGIKGRNGKFIKVYPNPSSGVFELKSRSPIMTATIYDLNGRLLNKTSFVSGALSETVNLENLNSGIYLMTVETSEGQTTERVVVK